MELNRIELISSMHVAYITQQLAKNNKNMYKLNQYFLLH